MRPAAMKGRLGRRCKILDLKAMAPHLNRLSTGEIVLCHRVPNTSVHISRDDGKTWQGPYEIDNVIGAYPSTVELKDHSVLIVYYTEGPGSHIRAKRFSREDRWIRVRVVKHYRDTGFRPVPSI
jgi:hypothetical protein